MNKFYKYHGSGNDFILIEDLDRSLLPAILPTIPKLCHRHLGIGADGVLFLQKSNIADAKMRIFNADGSEATMCGNGLRCIIRHLNKPCNVETKAGICIGEPLSKKEILASLPKGEIVQSPIALINESVGHFIDTGTPHLVMFLSELTDQIIFPLYHTYKDHSMFGNQGINLNFAKVDGSQISLRTFEKGVGETLSCGTGGAASALIARKLYKLSNEVQIHYPKVTLDFSFDTKGRIWMKGAAELLYKGTFSKEAFL